MAYRRPQQPRSPPRNFKVSFDVDPPLEQADQNFISTLIPKLVRTYPTAQQLQVQVSNQLCKHFQKSVGVSVVEKKEDSRLSTAKYRRPISFSFSMDEFLYRVWLHEHQVQFEEKPFEAIQRQL